MNPAKAIQIIKEHKGDNLRAIWVKPLKTLKGINVKVEKLTSIVVRGGVDYDNMKKTKEGREDGTLPSENQGLPWGEWVSFPIHIAHKGQDYIRLYPANDKRFDDTKVEYYINGELANKETAQRLCLASEFRTNTEPPSCFTVKADNLKEFLV